MNRCHVIRWVVPALALLACATVFSQSTPVRTFPAKALRGSFVVVQAPNVTINGEPAQLSPGARIRDEANRVVMSSSITGNTYLVNYTRELNGLIHEVWILTPTEAEEKRAGMETKTNFQFASDAEKPPVDDGKTPFNQLPKFKK